MNFIFAKFSDEEFTRFCNDLLMSVIGPGVQPLGAPGKDLGRDAFFSGATAYQSLKGEFVFQYKFHHIFQTGQPKAKSAFKKEVPKELAKIKKNFPATDHVIFLTSVTLTSGDFKKLSEEAKSFGFKTVEFWDHTKLDGFLTLHAAVKAKYFTDESIKLGQIASRLEATLEQKLTIERRVELLRESVAKNDEFFKYEIQIGEGEPADKPGAIFTYARYEDPDSQKYVAISVFEKFAGALEKSPIALSLQLHFSNDEEGLAAKQNFIDFFERGTEVTIDEKFIANIQVTHPLISDLAGNTLAGSISLIPVPGRRELVPLEIKALGARGKEIASIRYMPFKYIRGGSKEILIATSDDRIPLYMELKLALHAQELKFRVRPVGHNARFLLPYAKFIEAMPKAASIEFIHLIENKPLLDAPGSKPIDKELKWLVDFIKALSKIEDTLGISIPFPNPELIEKKDVGYIFALTKTGLIEILLRHIQFVIPVDTLANFAAIEDIKNNKFTIGPVSANGPVKLFKDTFELDPGPFYLRVPGAIFEGIDFASLYRQAIDEGLATVSIDHVAPEGPVDAVQEFIHFSKQGSFLPAPESGQNVLTDK